VLLPDNIHPEQTIYYNASHVLNILLRKKQVPLFELYMETNLSVKITVPVFLLSLDWLFLINIINYMEDGSIVLCI
jgi:hypothetical protein